MLGLERGTVRLVDHSPEWTAAFDAERRILRQALSGLQVEIEHIGSTAVPGLPAKPILDNAVGIPVLDDVDVCITRLKDIGYEYRGDMGDDGGHVLVRGRPDSRTHYIHVVELDGDQWRRYLKLRDLLRSDPEARDEYARVKRDLARRFPQDRKSYTISKEETVKRLLGQAR